MKLHNHLLLVLGCSIVFFACTNVPVDPIIPVVHTVDTNIVANKVKFTVDLETQSISIPQGQHLQLAATVTAHKDPKATDSTVRNYVLKDSTILWSISSGVGSISSKGRYSAPMAIDGTSEEVVISARANVDPSTVSIFRLTVRKPNLMPLLDGSYWVREHCPLDSISGQRLETQKYHDSSVVTGTVTIGGRQASRVTSYRNGVAYDTVYFSNENNTIWLYTQVNDNLFFVNEQYQWIKIIDPSLTSWSAYDSTFTNHRTTLNSQAVSLNGSVKVSCTRSEGDSLLSPTGKVYVHKVVTTNTVNFTVDGNGIRIPVKYTQQTTRWVSEQYGVMRTTTQLTQVSCSECCSDMQSKSEETLLISASLK